MLQQRVRGQHGVVRLDDGRRDLRRRVDREAELGLLAVVDGESLEEEGAESGSSASTDSVEDDEALETSALISELSDSVEAEIDDLERIMDIPDQDMLSWATKQEEVPLHHATPLLTRILAYTP